MCIFYAVSCKRNRRATSSKGFQYLHTRDFVSALRQHGIHFSEVEANAWIAREQTYFVDKTPDHSENRLWMMANMRRVL
ncbi:TPA: hypothetical protein ACWXAV_005070 [Klebsiella pneumoniae]